MKYIRIEGDVAFVELTRGQEAKIDVADIKLVRGFSWQAVPHPRGGFYARGSKVGYMHRLIAGVPEGLDTDHINHDTLDNRRENLKVCTRQGNMANGKFALATHCPRGHEYTQENTYRDRKGRRCRQCSRERMAAIYANETPEQRESRRRRVKAYYDSKGHAKHGSPEHIAKILAAKRARRG